MLAWSVLALCAVVFTGVESGTTATTATTKNRDRRFTFLNIVKDRPSSESSYKFPVLPVELPIQLGGHGGVNLPVLVLPVPVPVYTKSDSCDAPQTKPPPVENDPPNDISHPSLSATPKPEDIPSTRKPWISLDDYLNDNPSPVPPGPGPPPPQRPTNSPPPKEVTSEPPPSTEFADSGPPRRPTIRPLPKGPVNGSLHKNPGVINRVGNSEHVVEQGQIPYSEGRGQIFATTADLIQSFRQETPEAPELPAVIPRGRRFPDRIPPTDPDSPPQAIIFAPSPPRPHFGRSLRLRIDLTVPRSDYTEVYDIDWHAESNTVFTQVEDGATIIYRVPLVDGRVQFLKIQEDRLNGTAVRRCTMSPLLPATPANKTFPGLPDLSLFHFVGYTAAEGRSLVERWSHWVVGKPGEGGAARGESLNFSHDFFMYRDGGHAMPLKYTVVTHSSVLGPACDTYTHRYRPLPKPTSPSLPDLSQCDVTEEPKEERRQQNGTGNLVSEAISAVNDFFYPIGDFLSPTRHPKYDSMFDDYKDKFRRNYRDVEEEAVRKQQFIKTNRFVDAANRIAVTFKTDVNAFADRVKEERDWLFGAVPPPPDVAAPPGFGPEVNLMDARSMAKDLPKSYDWRKDQSFETPVRDQTSKCMSCWAFAVAGATEGAFFKKTKQNVSLSAQTMIDCGDTYEVTCNGGWPDNAFRYVKENGLPPWEENVYKAQVQPCKNSAMKMVTRISDFHTVSASEDALKVAIHNRAPTVVVLRAKSDSFISLAKDKVIDDTKCSTERHAVLAVGWGTDTAGKTHFIIKNSWGTTWSNGGYGKVATDYCGIREYASYPVM